VIPANARYTEVEDKVADWLAFGVLRVGVNLLRQINP
jgi:hypothetical protein